MNDQQRSMAAATANRTILSIGILVKTLLSECLPNVPVYAVRAPVEGTLPAVVYRRAELDAQQVKTGRPATTCYVEMEVWSDRYEEGISIAEAIRTKLDGLTTEWADGALRLRSCYLDNAYEDATQDGLYVQALRFRMSS